MTIAHAGNIPISETHDLIAIQYDARIKETDFPYKSRSLKIRKFIFGCCKPTGFSLKPNKGASKSCKQRAIIYTSNTLSGIATGLLTLLTLGGYAYAEYNGYLKDKNKVQEIQILPK